MKKFRQIAEKFAIDGGGNLDQLTARLKEVLDEMPGDKAGAVEAAIVEHLENSLNDVFGIECAIEDVFTRDEE